MSLLSVVLGLIAGVITYIVLTTYILGLPAILDALIAIVVFFLVAQYGDRLHLPR